MNRLETRVSLIINQVEPEWRIAVLTAVNQCDGTVVGFQMELASQTWEYPALPVQEIMDQLAFDCA